VKELSLNILDIAENSIKARAKTVSIALTEEGRTLTLCIEDDGCGMKKEMLETVTDPFTTSRTTRSVGLGLPLLKLAAEQTGGFVTVESRYEGDCPEDHGTRVTALFYRDHVDCEPLGDIVSTVTTLVQGAPETDFVFSHRFSTKEVSMDTRLVREALGNGVSLAAPEVIQWIAASLHEEYGETQ